MVLTEEQKALLDKVINFDGSDAQFDEIKDLIETTRLDFINEENGFTLLHTAIVKYVNDNSLKLIELIISQSEFKDFLDCLTKKGNTAIRLAIHYGYTSIFKLLHNNNATYHRQETIELVKKRISKDPAKTAHYQEIIDFVAADLVNLPKRIRDKARKAYGIYAYPRRLFSEAKYVEFKRQRRITEKFFCIDKPLNKARKSYKLFKSLEAHLKKNPLLPLSLNGYSARTIVIALSKVISKRQSFPRISFTIGSTTIECTPSDAKERQIGNVLVKIRHNGSTSAPSYGEEMRAFFRRIFGPENSPQRQQREVIFAKLLQQRAHVIQGFSNSDFNSEGLIRLEGEESYDVTEDPKEKLINKIASRTRISDFLNFMHVIGEVTRRLYRSKDGKLHDGDKYCYPEAPRSDSFPVGSFHARILELIINGYISWNDAYGDSGENFDKRAKYGVVAGKNTIRYIESQVEKKAERINHLMSQLHRKRNYPHYAQSHPDTYFQTSASWLRIELGEQFGGDSESSEDDYSANSDTEYLSTDENNDLPLNMSALAIEEKEGFSLHRISGDGNCLFRAIAHLVLGDQNLHQQFREQAAEYLKSHSEDLLEFFSGSQQSFQQHLAHISQVGVWADMLEIYALSQALDRPIVIVYVDRDQVPTIINETGADEPLFLAYHYGLHYSALTINSQNSLANTMRNIQLRREQANPEIAPEPPTSFMYSLDAYAQEEQEQLDIQHAIMLSLLENIYPERKPAFKRS